MAVTARGLLSDFREVEQNFRNLDRDIREPDRDVGRLEGRVFITENEINR